MYVLSCESTADLTCRYLQKRNIPVIAYSYVVDGKERFDSMQKNEGDIKDFYKELSGGAVSSTSQICEERYAEFFKEQLLKGDLLHIAFDSGLSRSVENAFAAAEKLKKEFPERKITVIDSTCGSLGYGLLVDVLADMRDSGKTMEELSQFALSVRKNVHHEFYTTTMKYFRKSGRVSTPAALIGDLLKICPLMRVNKEGKIVAYGKALTARRAREKMIQSVRDHISGGSDYGERIWIGHSDCLEEAEWVKSALEKEFPKADVHLGNLGEIIGSHCGPGTVAVYFFGDERAA